MIDKDARRRHGQRHALAGSDRTPPPKAQADRVSVTRVEPAGTSASPLRFRGRVLPELARLPPGALSRTGHSESHRHDRGPPNRDRLVSAGREPQLPGRLISS